jgi:hypothetical protein
MGGALELLDGAGYYIKDALWRYADEEMRQTWAKERSQKRAR